MYNVDNPASLSVGVPRRKGLGNSTLLTASLAMAKMSTTIGREVAVRTVLRTPSFPLVFSPSFHCHHIPFFVYPYLAGRPPTGAVPGSSSMREARPWASDIIHRPTRGATKSK